MLHLMGAQPEANGHKARKFKLEAPDLESLLVEWLQEWLYLLETEDRVPVDVSSLNFEQSTLIANVTDAPVKSLLKHIKAATYHGLRLEAQEEGYLAEIVFDV